jgi:hypothetical protein
MQAKNGSGVAHSRRRLIACVSAVAIAISALALSPAAGATPPPSSYVALGDSLAFGYSQHVFLANLPGESPSAYEEGYVNFFAKKLKSSTKIFGEFNPGVNLAGLVTTNQGCPGETSASFNGEEAPCAYHNTTAESLGITGYHFPLHHEYTGCSPSSACETPQLLNTVEVLRYDEALGIPVYAVTLDIGANDLLHAKANCEATFAEKGYSSANECVFASAPALFQSVGEKIGRIIGTIRSPEGGNYKGPIVLSGLYNPFGQTVAGAGELTTAFNGNVLTHLVSVFGGAAGNIYFANPYPVFNPKDTKLNPNKEEQRICELTNMCPEGHIDPVHGDIHPTLAGYKKLAGVLWKQEVVAAKEGKL